MAYYREGAYLRGELNRGFYGIKHVSFFFFFILYDCVIAIRCHGWLSLFRYLYYVNLGILVWFAQSNN